MCTGSVRALVAVIGTVALAAACGGSPQVATPPAATPAPAAAAAQTFDVVIANGRVVDGTGAPWFRADVGITGDRITAIGNLSAADAATRIDAAEPGGRARLHRPARPVGVQRAGRRRAASKITQGITTEITGEGVSIAPVNDPMMADRKASYDCFKVTLDLRTLNEYFARL